MKTTYLLNKTLPDGSVCLAVATVAEWREVARANRGLPPERRRYFITDYIKDGTELDCMVIEVPMEVYRAWHRDHMASVRNQARGKRFQHLSFETMAFQKKRASEDGVSYVPDDQVENLVCDKAILLELRKELAAWKPWGNDLLDLYLLGQKRVCTKILTRKYGVSPQTARKYRRQFEEYIKKYFLGVSF